MRMRRPLALIVAGLLALAACTSDTVDDVADDIEDSTDITVADETEQNAMDLASQVEEQMNTLADEIQGSDAADELQSAWNDLQAELTAAIASMNTDGSIETEGIQQELDNFQSELEAAGEDVTPELRDAWDELRSDIQGLMS